MTDATITAIFATLAAAILGRLRGYLCGRHDGRSIGWLERYYAELDAATKRAQRFAHLHPRQGGQFVAKEGASK
jgi:membrane protein DedA with SNARE-associated domain